MQHNDTGTVLQVQAFSVNDGDGIRTTIFLPGCPLRCLWCANPESQTPVPKLAVYHGKCTDCASCAAACPQGLFPPREASLAKAGCSACGSCAEVCPSGALAVLVEDAAAADIIRRVERDAVFFRSSGGGVTFSGGEPTFQTAFLRTLAEAFYKRGIDMCMETCGFFVWEHVNDILAKMDHIFLDLKHMDPTVHTELTGVPNTRILENAAHIGTLGIPVTVRIPFIPEVNGTRENLAATAAFIKKTLPGADIELLPFHTLGHEKYRALGMEPSIRADFRIPEEHETEAAEALLRSLGLSVVRYR